MDYVIKTIYAILVTCVIYIGLIFLTTLGQAQAEEQNLPNWQEDNLTGDWGGLRTDLYRNGIDIGLTHKSDVLSNLSGGLKRGTAWLGHTEVRFTFDLDKLLNWQETTINIVYQSDLGSKFNTNYVGAFMGVDNIEVGTNTAQFYEAWVQKNFFDGHASLLAGLYPIDTEFYLPETSGIFIQPPYGMANEVAQTGVNGPPIFPLGALGARFKVTSPHDDFYLQAALTDGVPGDPNNPRGTHVQLGGGDGSFAIVELGYTPKEQAMSAEQTEHREMTTAQLNVHEQAETFNKTAIGFWRFSSQFDAIDGSENKSRSYGTYLIAERTLFLEPGHPSQGLSAFLRYGRASEKVNQIDWSGSLGLRYHGLVYSRDNDITGVAVTVNHTGRNYRQANEANHQEVNIEATYLAQITPYLAIQPTVQYITNPGMDKALKDVTVVGFRTEVTF